MWKFAYDDMEELTQSPSPRRYEDIGHQGNAIAWMLVGDKMLFGSSHMDIAMMLANEMGKSRAWEVFQTSWRGRYDPENHETSVTRYDAERDHLSIPTPSRVIEKLKLTFPEVERIWSFVSDQPVLGSFNEEQMKRIRKYSSWHRKFITAAVKDDLTTPFMRDSYLYEIGDVDRYNTDKYGAEVTFRETENLYSIGFQMYNYQVGITGSSQYWHYDKNEKEQALETFAQIKNILANIIAELEYTRPPMAVITPLVRAALSAVDIGHKERSGNYFYNWFKELPKESDWRTTIYGKRYPTCVVQPLNTFWNVDENGKKIVTKGTSKRNRIISYKQASFDKNAGVAKLLAKYWGFGAATAMALALIFTEKGGNLQQLEQAYRNGVTQQQIQQSIESSEEIRKPETIINDQKIPETEVSIEAIDTRNLEGLQPHFRMKVEQVLRYLQAKGWQPKVAEGLRTVEEQQKKINQGYSSLKNPRNSKHVQGLAADIIDKRYGWSGDASNLNFAFWKDLGEATRKVGLEWGGDWKSFPDVAHVQFPMATTK